MSTIHLTAAPDQTEPLLCLADAADDPQVVVDAGGDLSVARSITAPTLILTGPLLLAGTVQPRQLIIQPGTALLYLDSTDNLVKIMDDARRVTVLNPAVPAPAPSDKA